ncbi:MAG: SMC-Scp complex subunit ScpB [Firmicutes bacterium]|jgi:segregation and condensation protein B|nr:SMC-Scp complex subunit ScpB [Bacillota bacterium]
MEYNEARAIIEALIFASPSPISAKRIGEITGLDSKTVQSMVKDVQDKYRRDDSGIQIVFVAGGYEMATKPQFADYVSCLNIEVRQSLSRPALETLAIIAYRQPVTKPELETIRGVRVDSVLNTLMERCLVRVSGRKKAPGRPALYCTTSTFLRWFGLASLDELPPLTEDSDSLLGILSRSQ